MEHVLAEYKIADNLLITETTSIDHLSDGRPGRVFNYYANGEYVFGVMDRFTEEDLENLYMNEYFDDYLI